MSSRRISNCPCLTLALPRGGGSNSSMEEVGHRRWENLDRNLPGCWNCHAVCCLPFPSHACAALWPPTPYTLEPGAAYLSPWMPWWLKGTWAGSTTFSTRVW